jgi:hypothetical protein
VYTSVSGKIEVSNTLSYLDQVNTSVIKTEVSSKTSIFSLLDTLVLTSFFFFPKMKYSQKLKYPLPRHVNTTVLKYFNFRKKNCCQTRLCLDWQQSSLAAKFL